MTEIAQRMLPDEETIARALLTHCIDSADALMFATLKGCENAVILADLLVSIHRGGSGRTAMETCFAHGLTRWGRHVTAQGLQAFRRALVRWLTRMDTLPTDSPEGLLDHFPREGSLWLIAPHSGSWPQQLNDLSTRKDWAPPLCLWGRGDVNALTSCTKPIAVVGSRGANDYGRDIARSIAQTAADSGHLVISGGALGIDAAAHWGALAAMRYRRDDTEQRLCGRTVAVFAGGLDHIGPHANDNLFAGILEYDGALISELSPQAIPEPRRFLLRNRIIAALASYVVVTQARRRSGALNTANWAADLGREVYAAPGEITMASNAGCNLLIRDNKAIILCSVTDISIVCHDAHTADHSSRMLDTTTIEAPSPPSTSSSDTVRSDSDLPRHVATPDTSNMAASSSDMSHHDVVLHAIRSCRAHRQVANVDNMLAALRVMEPPVPPHLTTPQGLTRLLGVMELADAITYDHGIIAPVKSHAPGTATASGHPQPSSATTHPTPTFP